MTTDGTIPQGDHPARRYGWAIALLLLGAGAVIGSTHWPVLRHCEEVVASVGTAPVAETCRPLSVTDAPVVLVVAASLLILLPELKSIKIAGLLELEREVKEARTQVEVLGSRVLALSQNTSVNVNLAPGTLDTTYARAEESRVQFEAELERLGSADQAALSPAEQRDQERRALEEAMGHLQMQEEARSRPDAAATQAPTRTEAELVTLLLTLTASIDGVRARAQGVSHASLPDWVATRKVFYTPRGEQVLRRWMNVFDDEYRVIRDVRSAVAHGQRLTPEELAKAVDMAADVLAYAYGGVTGRDERTIPDETVQRAWALVESEDSLT